MKLLTERSEEKFWSSFNFFNSFFYIYKSAGCRQSIFFTHIANKLFFSHTFGSKLFLGVNLANKLFFTKKPYPPPEVLNGLPLIHFFSIRQSHRFGRTCASGLKDTCVLNFVFV